MPADESLQTRGLLDTCVVIDRARISTSSLPEFAAISAITLGELAIGVHAVQGSSPAAALERASRTLVLQQVENEFDPIPYGEEAARVFGTLGAAVMAIGRKPRARSLDLMIAATAVVEGVPLYTTNPGDFAGLESILEIIAIQRSS